MARVKTLSPDPQLADHWYNWPICHRGHRGIEKVGHSVRTLASSRLTKLRGSVRLSDVLDRFAVAAFGHWRERLAALLDALWEHKSQTRHFAAKLFLFFIGLNVACY